LIFPGQDIPQRKPKIESMKIVEITDSSPTTVFIQRHIASLQEKNVDLNVVALYDQKKGMKNAASIPEEDLIGGKIKVPISRRNQIVKYASVRYLLKPHTVIPRSMSEKIFSAYLESLHPDLIHFHMANFAASLYQIPVALQIPYTVSLRGSDIQVLPFQSEDRYRKTEKALQGASGIHSVSDALWESAVTTFHSIPESIYHKTIYTTVPIERLQFTRLESGKLFVAVGRFHWRKSFPLLIIAFKKFCEVNPDVKLYIIGNGELSDCLNYWIRSANLEKKVFLKDKMSYPELKETISHADALIQSSIAEGFSNATAEAMALGCPVFATDVGGTREIIKDGVNGFLLNPFSPESWSEKFQFIFDKPLMSKVGENGYKTACEHFDKRVHSEQFVEFFETALNIKENIL
jgi:glycosyltransferase involved in cell wall biosynthesis